MESSGHTLQNGSQANTQSFSQRLLHASYQKAAEFKRHVPSMELIQLLDKATALLKQEPTLLEFTMEADCRVLMVGDTHGQLHDVVHMLELMGPPSQNQMYIFNGDFVDRGAWGVELLALLVSLKLEHRTRVHLLRGNHEGSTCTRFYGFKGELDAKYGGPESRAVYAAFKRVFAVLPLAALVQGKTLILHGGLYRFVAPPEPKEQSRGKGGSKAKRRRVAAADPLAPLLVGDLSVLRGASKGGVDPDGRGSSAVAADVLWSDPVMEPGLRENELRGVGLTFGPDITQAFLEANDLRLILRSHEGPDARDRRDDMPQVIQGYALDHDTPAGRLMTVFSAPDYPQFMSSHETRYNNKGAVAVLSGPTWHEPHIVSFEAARPRPEATAFYEYETYPDTDDELMAEELGAASSQGAGSSMSEAMGALTGGGEITSQVTSQVMDPPPPFLSTNGPSAPTGLPADAGGKQGLVGVTAQPVLDATSQPLMETVAEPVLLPVAAALATAGAQAPTKEAGSSGVPDAAGQSFTSGDLLTAGAPAIPAEAAIAGPLPIAAPSHPSLHPLLQEVQGPVASPGHATTPPSSAAPIHAISAPLAAPPGHGTAPPSGAASAAEGAGESEQGPSAAHAAPAPQTTSPLAPPSHSTPPAAPPTKAEPAPAWASDAAVVREGSAGLASPQGLSEMQVADGPSSTAQVTTNSGHGVQGVGASAVPQDRQQLVLSPDMQQQLLAILQQPQQQPQQQQQVECQGCEPPAPSTHEQRLVQQGAMDTVAPPCEASSPVAAPGDHAPPPCEHGASPAGQIGQQQGRGQGSCLGADSHRKNEGTGGHQECAQSHGDDSTGGHQACGQSHLTAQQPAQAWQVPAGSLASHVFAVASPWKSNDQ